MQAELDDFQPGLLSRQQFEFMVNDALSAVVVLTLSVIQGLFAEILIAVDLGCDISPFATSLLLQEVLQPLFLLLIAKVFQLLLGLILLPRGVKRRLLLLAVKLLLLLLLPPISQDVHDDLVRSIEFVAVF